MLVISELHYVYSHFGLSNQHDLKNRMSNVIFQVAAGLYETAYIMLISLEDEGITFLTSLEIDARDTIYAFYRVFDYIEKIVND